MSNEALEGKVNGPCCLLKSCRRRVVQKQRENPFGMIRSSRSRQWYHIIITAIINCKSRFFLFDDVVQRSSVWTLPCGPRVKVKSKPQIKGCNKNYCWLFSVINSLD